MRTAQNNIEWQNLREAYVQQRIQWVNDNDDILLIFEMRKQQSNEIQTDKIF